MGPNPNGPRSGSCYIELLDSQFFFGVRSVGPVGDFLDTHGINVWHIYIYLPTMGDYGKCRFKYTIRGIL